MTFRPTNSFQTLAGVPVHYARPPVAPYGTRGEARTWLATPDFERRLDRAFAELWERCPLGPAEVITSAGAWVDKPGRHGKGRGFDLDALFWPAAGPRERFLTLHFPGHEAFYLAVESVLRRHFGTVLGYLYDAAHRDHFHVDDGTPVAWERGSRSRVLYVQAALRHLHRRDVRIDGVYGPETDRHLRGALRRMGLDADLARPATWLGFLQQNADLGFARSPQPGLPEAPAPAPVVSVTATRIIETREQVRIMKATTVSQLERLEQMLSDLLTMPKEEPDGDGEGGSQPPRFRVRGRMSTFGGPSDRGVDPDEGLALYEPHQVALHPELFLPAQPPGTTGLARRLDPEADYLACRWDYLRLGKAALRGAQARVRNPRTGATATARPVDWGPAEWTGRVADLSPGLARKLGLQTDDQVEVTIP